RAVSIWLLWLLWKGAREIGSARIGPICQGRSLFSMQLSTWSDNRRTSARFRLSTRPQRPSMVIVRSYRFARAPCHAHYHPMQRTNGAAKYTPGSGASCMEFPPLVSDFLMFMDHVRIPLPRIPGLSRSFASDC